MGLHRYIIRTQDAQYMCALCQKTYIIRTSLYGHLKSTHFPGLYRCPLCNHASNRKEHLIKHLVRMHKVTPWELREHLRKCDSRIKFEISQHCSVAD